MIVLTCSSWKFSLPNVKDSIKIVRHNESDTSCRRLPNAVHTLSCMIRGLICHVYLNSIWVLCVPARKCPDHGAPPKPKAVVEVYSLLVLGYQSTEYSTTTWNPIIGYGGTRGTRLRENINHHTILDWLVMCSEHTAPPQWMQWMRNALHWLLQLSMRMRLRRSSGKRAHGATSERRKKLRG